MLRSQTASKPRTQSNLPGEQAIIVLALSEKWNSSLKQSESEASLINRRQWN